jgi:hypothetical protein
MEVIDRAVDFGHIPTVPTIGVSDRHTHVAVDVVILGSNFRQKAITNLFHLLSGHQFAVLSFYIGDA